MGDARAGKTLMGKNAATARPAPQRPLRENAVTPRHRPPRNARDLLIGKNVVTDRPATQLLRDAGKILIGKKLRDAG